MKIVTSSKSLLEQSEKLLASIKEIEEAFNYSEADRVQEVTHKLVEFYRNPHSSHLEFSKKVYDAINQSKAMAESLEELIGSDISSQRTTLRHELREISSRAIYAWVPWFSTTLRWTAGVILAVLLYSTLVYWSKLSKAEECDANDKKCEEIQWEFVIPIKDSINQFVTSSK
ncbi:hypothetical protein FLL45_20905 [Aliikangiella marina]|uniref:Uncharacterized protein n=1 Tax=Aliikangiella marina TaxID=1712262 RepID=A0A545T316_9GAMM|nr:hypothetical protein [Aliikangiella marina]TQV71612.1 hypothetical protein FLL45_20905 [Aliikangiella marina]